MKNKIVNNITELIGQTPVVRIKAGDEQSATVYAKLEYFNPGGSVKDRIAYQMIQQAIEDGELKPGGTIVEPTSGNTGIGLAMSAAALGFKAVIIMPDNYSEERRRLVKAYGAELILTPEAEGIAGAIALAEKLVAEKGYFMPMQFENKANVRAHELTTGPEILEAFEEIGLDAFVAGAGTGGTISGVSHYLKDRKPEIKTYVVEPAESPVLRGGEKGSHNIQGIGVPFISPNLDETAYDGIIDVSTEEAMEASRLLAKSQGISLGISSGAAIHAAYQLADKLGAGKNVLVLCPDSGERYLSTELYADLSN
ncbi:cysteine synthase A [Lactococcus termiticola]|uniref:Cysteine synthase n=1 Tax=Lactococcus termiticola TaxID=2169526 RepID=A0A2R5HGW0_9LACT|nr:cysteine synthase A [Lactococcus termiticola]GBG97297.1 cysteine synthase [Lactococcus termiticola]